MVRERGEGRKNPVFCSPFLLQLISQLETTNFHLAFLFVIEDALIGLSMDGWAVIIAKAS